MKENFDDYVSRINPSNLKEENEYFDMLRKLCADKLVGMPHPDVGFTSHLELADKVALNIINIVRKLRLSL